MDKNEEEQWRAVGQSAREAKKRGGCIGWLILIGIIIVLLLYFFSVMQK